MSALDRAIETVGGVGKLAAAIGVVASAVSNWRQRGCEVPAAHCAAVEAATGGAVTRRELRPDDWARIWPELVGTASTQPTKGGRVAA